MDKRRKISSVAYGAILIAALLIPSVVLPGVAHADRKSALEDQPAVRHRLLLVKNRFEAAIAFESSVNAEFQHTISGGLKLEYHLSDMLSVGGVGFLGGTLDTGLTSRIVDSLPENNPDVGDPTPTKREFSQHLNSIPLHGAAYVTITPWYGKLAAFGKFFVNFDFYFSGGLSFASLSNDCQSSVCDDPNPGGDPMASPIIPPDNDPNDDPPLNDGFKPGLYLGGGIHVFINNWIAIDLTVRDYVFSDNPSGLDFDADLAVTDDDTRFLNHLFMGVGVSFFFPAKVERTP